MKNPSASLSREFVLDCIELLAAVFRGPHSSSTLPTCPGMLTAGVQALAEETTVPDDLATPLTAMAACVDRATTEKSFCEQLEIEYVHLFIATKGGVDAPLYQSCYESASGASATAEKGRTMGPSALAMEKRLTQAGLQVAGPGNEPADHISTELEYLYYLLHTGAAAEDAPKAGVFVETVMLPWIDNFAGSVMRAAPDTYHGYAVQLLKALLKSIPKS